MRALDSGSGPPQLKGDSERCSPRRAVPAARSAVQSIVPRLSDTRQWVFAVVHKIAGRIRLSSASSETRRASGRRSRGPQARAASARPTPLAAVSQWSGSWSDHPACGRESG